MKTIVKNVTVRELYDILCAKCKLRGLPPPEFDHFVFNLSVTFIHSPAMEMRYHDLQGNVDNVYVVKHNDIAFAVEKKPTVKVDDPI